MKVTYCSVKNKLQDKPNEDNIWVDSERNIFLVVDGVSRDRINGVYPHPSPSAILTAAFVDYCKSNYTTDCSLTTLFQNANNQIWKINESYVGDFKPSLVALILRFKENIIEWVSIGDCIGVLIKNGTMEIFNTKQTERLRKSDRKFDSKTIRTDICNNPEHSLAYGVLDGNKNANSFLEYGEFNVEKNDVILALTDGLEMIAKPEFTTIIITSNVHQIVLLAEQIEREQNIRTDDKTIIKIEI